ncbi:MAG: UvrD-helicase domain-containing protein, partial [Anaerolineae bacterium]
RAAAALQLWRDLWLRLETTYTHLKDQAQALDFDDLEGLTERLLTRGQADERLSAFLSGINHLMVDEFQDTNEAQRAIVYAIADPHRPGHLFVVGDAKQSIYRFRQAQVSVFTRTARDVQAITGHGAVPLSESFRTHRALVAAQNEAFAAIMAPMGDDYCDYEARPGPLVAERVHSTATPSIDLLLLPAKDGNGDSVDAEHCRLFEAQQLAGRLLSLYRSGYPVWDRRSGEERPFRFSDAAVLFRATTQMPLYEEQFQAAGLPYLTVAGRGYYDRPEVTDLISLLACLYNPADDLSLAVVLRSPLFSLSDETLFRLRGALSQPVPLRQALASPPLTGQPERVAFAAATLANLWSLAGRATVWELLRRAIDRTGYEATLALADAVERGGGRQRSNLHKFLALAYERGHVGLSQFLRLVQNLRQREVREGEAMAAPPEAGAVQLMSVHAAKGLEFPVVAVADLGRENRGSVRQPHVLDDPEFGLVCRLRDDQGDLLEPMGYAWAKWLQQRMESAESKRLLYVACTRAADLLLLSGKAGKRDCWLEALLDAWGIEADGSTEEVVAGSGYTIAVRRPAYEPVDRRLEPGEVASGEGLADVPPLAGPVPVAALPRTVAVTRLQRLLAADEEAAPELHPPLRTSGGDANGVPGYVLGRMVHGVLADWECLAMPNRALTARLRQAGRREGLADAALADAIDRAHRMVERLRRSAVYEQIDACRERHSEVPFTLSLGDVTLRGAIDLLYRDGGGWHVLDWKTEWLKEGAPIAADPHLTQVAVYARAAQEAIGAAPTAEVCFLQSHCRLHRYEPDELDGEWARLLALVGPAPV